MCIAPILWVGLLVAAALVDTRYSLIAASILCATILSDVIWYVHVDSVTCERIRWMSVCVLNVSAILMWLASKADVDPIGGGHDEPSSNPEVRRGLGRRPVLIIVMATILVLNALIPLAAGGPEPFSNRGSPRPYMRNIVYAAAGIATLRVISETVACDGFWDGPTIAILAWASLVVLIQSWPTKWNGQTKYFQ